ncbi:F-box protein FBW2 [Iris pallida]|uniref:F-box protein FBW2 n=1 Tax=Iris pallida TaxID=29817 RepID=A0AAX6HKB7_IRIPA|nr:F-box protein FBW2 [Iris pallida]
MEDCCEYRAWGDLIPDALGLIFRNLPLQEILTVIPRVCKSWGRAVSGPYCWQQIDIEEWSQRCKPEQLDSLVRMLVARSNGSVRRLAVFGLPDDNLFSFVADHAGSLQTLVLPRSKISDSIVEQVSARLSNLTFLDVSYCKKIGPRALEAFGNNCKSLTGLRRTMHPLEVADKVSQDDEAFAIASTMPKLRHLEVAYLLLTTHGVLEILARCKELDYLDVRGCWEVKLDERLLKEKHAGLKVLGPHIVDSYEGSFWDDCSDYSDTSSVYSWEFMEDEVVYEGGSDDDSDDIWGDEQAPEGLEVRFYGGGFNRAFSGFHWPASP